VAPAALFRLGIVSRLRLVFLFRCSLSGAVGKGQRATELAWKSGIRGIMIGRLGPCWPRHVFCNGRKRKVPAALFSKDLIKAEVERLRSHSMEDYCAVVKLLRRLKTEGSILNGEHLDRELLGRLRQLSERGLVDPGYSAGIPWNWVSNSNGERVLKFLDQHNHTIDDSPPIETGDWEA
jgi:hypothetical protein